MFSDYFIKWILIDLAYCFFMSCLYEATNNFTVGLLQLIGATVIIIIPIYKTLKELSPKCKPLNYVFINNNILLTTETIENNGYSIVWSQQKGVNKQILTFNEKTQEFKAFDKYIYMDEKASYLVCTEMYWDDYEAQECKGRYICSDYLSSLKGKDLWTPIEFKNITLGQIKSILNTENKGLIGRRKC